MGKLFELLQGLGAKGARGFWGLPVRSSFCAGHYKLKLCVWMCLPEAGKQQVLLIPWGFNSTGPSMVASVNAQPGVFESLLVKVNIYKLNP